MSSVTTDTQDEGPLEGGDLVTTTIAEIGGDHVVVSSGAERFQLSRAELRDEPKVGQSLEVFLDGDPRGKVTASLHKAEALRLWEKIFGSGEPGAELDGEVVAEVRGGLAVDVGVRAFMPASQAGLRHVSDLGALIGERFRVRVIELDKRRGRVVVSRRALLEAERAVQRDELFRTLSAGDVVSGTVVGLVPYGAFVDIGGVDGLLRLEDMSWGHVRHGSQLFAEGEQLKVKILELDKEKGRVGLGVKQLQADPWASVSAKFAPGQRVQAKVLRTTEFGAFMELEPHVEGLCHVTELKWGKAPKKPTDVVHKNQVVEVQILDVNAQDRRISLSLRALQPNPWRALRDKYGRGDKVRGVVRSLTDFGAFLELETGVDGLLHASDMSWTERVRPADRYKVGDTVEVALLDVDVENERIALGVKQLTADPWLEATRAHPQGAKVVGKITGLTEFGVFVEIAPGVEGLCHISELTDERGKKPSEVAKVGDELTVVVLDADPQSRRISLSALAVDAPPPAPKAPEATFGNNPFAAKLSQKLGIPKS